MMASDEGASELARLAAKAVERAREEAQDIWADAQGLRQEEQPVLRRAATYGLAGLLRAGDVIAVRAREVAAQANARAEEVRSEYASRSGESR